MIQSAPRAKRISRCPYACLVRQTKWHPRSCVGKAHGILNGPPTTGFGIDVRFPNHADRQTRMRTNLGLLLRVPIRGAYAMHEVKHEPLLDHVANLHA